MAMYHVKVGFMVPYSATLTIEAPNADEAQTLALEQAWDTVPEYVPDIEDSGPLQTFDVWEPLRA